MPPQADVGVPPPAPPGDGDSADSTGAGGLGGGDEEGGPPPPVQGIPDACGPFAAQRFGITDNFAVWGDDSLALVTSGSASHAADVIDGGIEYTVLSCGSGSCIRAERLSLKLMDENTGALQTLAQARPWAPVWLGSDGRFRIPAHSIEFTVRTQHGGKTDLARGFNDRPIHGSVDKRRGTIVFSEFAVGGPMRRLAEVALVGNLRNTQPEATIVVERGQFNEVSLSARVWDAEGDALNLTWMLPRIGVFDQNTIDVALPPARQPVILFVRDAHLANTVAAVWLDGRSGGLWEG